MEKSFNENSIKEFAEVLAAKTSVPGGGGASALVGALAASLGSMVGNFTLGKPKYADFEPDIERLMEEAGKLRCELLECIDRDAEDFQPLAEAYGLPKDAPGRDETLEKCLVQAAAVPMRIAELSCRVIDMQEEFAKKGSKLMISDAGCGAVFAWAALYGAALNVRVNTRLMKNREQAEQINDKIDDLMNTYWQKADRVYNDVLDALK